jgi:hypothetical protein
MKPSLARNLQSRKRFLQEARAAAAIEHDNIIHIYAAKCTVLHRLRSELKGMID